MFVPGSKQIHTLSLNVSAAAFLFKLREIKIKIDLLLVLNSMCCKQTWPVFCAFWFLCVRFGRSSSWFCEVWWTRSITPPRSVPLREPCVWVWRCLRSDVGPWVAAGHEESRCGRGVRPAARAFWFLFVLWSPVKVGLVWLERFV